MKYKFPSVEIQRAFILPLDSSKSVSPDAVKYSEDQPRDAHGRFGSGGLSPASASEDYAASTHADNLLNLWHRVMTTTADGMGGDTADSISSESIDNGIPIEEAIDNWANNLDVRMAVKATVANDVLQQESMQTVATKDLIAAAVGDATPEDHLFDSAMTPQTNEDGANDKYGINVVELNAQGEINVYDYADILSTNGMKSGETTVEQVAARIAQQTAADQLIQPVALAGTPEAEALVREAATSLLVNQWAQTSNDSNPYSQALQQAAADQFNLDNHAQWEGMTGDLKAATDAAYETNGEVYKAFLQAQYDNTQEQLKAAGIESITVYRGSTIGDANVSEVAVRPMSSWSTSFNVATRFASADTSITPEGATLYRTTIPASEILSTAGTGFGCLNEFEVVALGGVKNVDSASGKSLEVQAHNGISFGNFDVGTMIDRVFAKSEG